jgi:formate dehydrogenase
MQAPYRGMLREGRKVHAERAGFVDIPGEAGRHRSYCRLCEAQCGIVAEVVGGTVRQIGPDRDHPVSQGHICVKGAAMVGITYDPDRVLTPLKRVGNPGEFVRVEWDEAIYDIAASLNAIIERDGGKAIGIYKGNPASFATLHAVYVAQFLKALGGDRSFNAVSIDTGAKNIAQELVFGSAVDWTFPDLEHCDFLIVIGANPLVSHMSLVAEPRALHKLNAIHERGGVVVVDPRRTETARQYEHVPIRPDSDAWMLGAMLNHIFSAGLECRELLETRTVGWEALREALAPVTPDVAATYCDVAPETIVQLAERFVRARTSACYGRVGTNRGRFSTLVNLLIESLNVVAGRFATAGGWVTGVSPMGDPKAPPRNAPYGSGYSRIGGFPLVLGSTPGGSLAAEITTPGDGQLKALFVDSGNPVLAYPDGERTAAALEQLELCVALDLYVTETSRHAHYILPATGFLEREDLTDYWVRNAPRPWVQYTPAVIAPRGEARHEYEVYNAILAAMGRPAMFAGAPLMQVADDMLRTGLYGDHHGARPEGLSIERLRQEFSQGVRTGERVDAEASWSRVRTPDGRIRLWHDVTSGEIVRLLDEIGKAQPGELKLFGRRKLGSLNSWMHNVDRLVRNARPTLQLHPRDAQHRGICDGQRVLVCSKTGSVYAEAELTTDVVPGSACYPHGWGHAGGWIRANGLPGTNINQLASSLPEDWERVSGNVHVDGIIVMVRPA